jgi:DNA-binding transcriptional LysR family regulator
MEIKKLIDFVETVQIGSINKAAERLDYTQSGLTYILNTLEEELGIQLLTRTHSGISLTAGGETLLPLIIKIVENEKALREEIRILTGDRTKVIRIGTYPSIAANWLPRIMESFKKKNPDVPFEIHIDVLSITKWLDDDVIDIGLVDQGLAAGYRWTYIKDDEMVLAMPLSSPLAKKTSIPPELLVDYQIILPSSNVKTLVTAYLKKRKIELKKQVVFNTYDGSLLLSMVKNGLGIACLSGIFSTECPEGICMRPFDPPLNRSLGVIVNDKRPPNKTVKQFIHNLSAQESRTSASAGK